MSRPVLALSGALLAAFAACGSNPPSTPTPSADPAPCTAAAPCPSATPTPTPTPTEPAVAAPLRRLTRAQYTRTIQDLLGPLTWNPGARFPADETAGPFVSNAVSPISELQVELTVSVAEAVAQEVTQDLPRVLGCPAPVTRACARGAVGSLARRAFRRPLEADERAGLDALVDLGASVEAGVGAALTAVLAAPSFLYHVEPGERVDDGRVRLSGAAVASRLSFLFWDEGPDEALLDAAEAGALDTAEGVAAAARRLYADPRARRGLGRFHLEWLGLADLQTQEKDPRRYPFYTPEVRVELERETLDFVWAVLHGSDARLRTLLAAPFSVPGAASRRIYGLGADLDPAPPAPTGLDPTQRRGLLTQPAFLAAHAQPTRSSPIHRGLVIATNLLCLPLGLPPPGVDISPIGADPTGQRSRRALVEAHASDPRCVGCHVVMDPLGLSFEHYDAVGAWRAVDAEDGRPIDSRVTVQTGADIDGPVDDAVALADRLANSSRVRACVALQWYRFALGRREDARDAPAVDRLRARFEATGGAIDDLLITLVESDAFRSRAP